MKYSAIIDGMTWSYSRVTCFEFCPYAFLLKYIMQAEQEPLFFSEYGKLIHRLISMSFGGLMEKDDLISYYIKKYSDCALRGLPNAKVFESYFTAGLEYIKTMELPENPILVEKQGSFEIKNKSFTGIIDCAYEKENCLIILDHKSHDLKPRSGRAKPTKTDMELDTYLRQLYIYSGLLHKETGRFPDILQFNCYRQKTLISEPFDEEVFAETVNWASETIDKITENDNWHPSIEFWKCRYLCDVHDKCEYYQTNRR